MGFPFSFLALIALDVAVWVVVIVATGWVANRRAAASFAPSAWLYRLRPWESDGAVYQRWCRVRAWKNRLPEGAAVWADGVTKRSLATRARFDRERLVIETCRAEWTHWMMLPALVPFACWNPPAVTAVMALGLLVANAPCVIVQRYNRGRLLKGARLSGSAG